MTINQPSSDVKRALVYQTRLGMCLRGKAEDVLNYPGVRTRLRHKVDLIFTSPPFPLNRKKKYGNLTGQAYVEWLASFADTFKSLLKPTGSFVIELGNAWMPGQPAMSTLALKALLELLEKGDFVLCQQFVWHNPARLPTPAQWVNVERIRVKDSFTHLWWMSGTARPYADNRSVLTEYSASMKKLLMNQKYNDGNRPSQHRIGAKSFLKEHAGAIPSNVITLANTHSVSDYQSYCRKHKIQCHPARMPMRLAEFFIKFLTKPHMLVLDPFGGSNTTGAAAEKLGRRWVTIEPNKEYLAGSRGRFNGSLCA